MAPDTQSPVTSNQSPGSNGGMVEQAAPQAAPQGVAGNATAVMDEPVKREVFKLPNNVMTKTDLSRLIRELQSLDNFLMQSKTRKPGESLRLPRLSLLLEHLAEDNGKNLLVDADREQMEKQLEFIHASGPVVHFSFASNPSAAFSGKLLSWLRREAHPYCLLQIGLQPGLGAGFTLRTTNKYFNFSMNKRFETKKDLLRDMLLGDDNDG